MLVIPVVLLMTIFVAWIWSYTIDRVSLFALIFSIGILVDDAIVVVENIYRRWLEEGHTGDDIAVEAVAEVGNPTILATFTVIAALLPMGFVSGMMGPYMEPIPALGSAAMFISLFAAFVFTPYLAISKWLRPSMAYLEKAEKREHKEAEKIEKLFRRILVPLIESKRKRKIFRLVLWGTFAFTLTFFYFKWVAVKMMPLDNKPEYTVVVDMPEGTALPVTANLAHHLVDKLRASQPEITAVQLYAGTARPYDFNGMVRHYYLRSDPGRRRSRCNSCTRRSVSAPVINWPSRPARSCCRWWRVRAPRSRWSRCRPDRRCSSRWWPRSMAPRRRSAASSPAR